MARIIGTTGPARAAPPPSIGGLPPIIRTPAPRPTRQQTATPPPIAHPRPVTAPVSNVAPRPSGGTDVQSSGGDYGSARAEAFKRTPAYAQAIAEVFAHQPTQQKAAIISGVLKGRVDQQTAKAITDAWHALPIYEKTTLTRYLPHPSGLDLGGLLGDVAKGIYSIAYKPSPLGGAYRPELPTAGKALAGGAAAGLTGLSQLSARATQGPTGLGQTAGISQAGVGGGALPKILLKAPADIAKATVQDPSVIPKTVKGLGETAIGSAAALAELPVKAWQEGPIKAGKQLAQGVAKDYSSRYGPLVAGNDKAFIARIKKEGAGSELLDALGFAGGADATLGRVASQFAGEFGRGGTISRALTGARPGLRISGDEVRAQKLANTAGRATLQRLEDKLRKARGSDNIELRPNEVRPLTRVGHYDHQMRVLISGISAKTRHLMQTGINREVRHGAEPAFRKLNSAEQRAAFHIVEGDVPLRSGSAAARRAINDKIEAIIAERARNPQSWGNLIPEPIRDKVDNLAQLRRLHDDVNQKGDLNWLTPKLADWQAGEAARSTRVESDIPESYTRQATAEARRLRSQGEKFGITHPDTLHDLTQAEAKRLEQHALRDAPKTIADAQREVVRLTGKLADARRREAVVLAKLRAGKGLAKPADLAEAKRAERAAEAALRERTAQLANARRQEDVHLARQGGIRGAYRGRTDITGKPLPKGAYEAIDAAQRRRAFAEERLRQARVDRGTARSRRAEIEKLNRHELPLPPESAERVFRHQRETAALEDALAHAKREHKSAKEYGRYATDEARTGAVRRQAEYLSDRDAHLRQYSARVRELAREAGLPEPAYMRHNALPKEDFTSYTTGTGYRAQPGVKRSLYDLHRGGAVDRSPQAFFDSIARGIRSAHQWRLVDEQARRNALPTVTRDAIHAALGEDKHPIDLTAHELSRVLLHQGVDLNHVQFYNPGRLAESTLHERDLATDQAMAGERAGSMPPELEQSMKFAHELGQDQTSFDGGRFSEQHPASLKGDEPFLKTKGWMALPRAAYDELHSSLSPSGATGRIVGKAQGLGARAILGLSPSFVIMNTLAHIYLATFGTRGRLLTDALKMPFWWHGLTEAERDVVRSHAGGRPEFHRMERMGSTAQGKLNSAWHDLRRKGVMRLIGHANPVRALFKAEDMQSNFFRHTTYYSAAKRQALHNITSDMGPAAAAAAKLNHALNTGPKDEMARILRSQPAAEELGRYTVNMMGDYGRFTSFERKWLNNRSVLFYSFLRHATRTLLHVLPVKHPIATALVGELGHLHNDEVKQMLGGADLPYANSRLFFKHGDGKLSSVDLLRSSPIGGLATDVATEGIKGLAHEVPPALQPILDMMYGQTVTGQPVHANAFQALSNFLSLSYPYRLAKDLRFGSTPQTSESIPLLHERPKQFKTDTAAGRKAKAYAEAKAKARGPDLQRRIAGALGAYPKPDDIREIAAHALAAQAKGKGKAKSSGNAWLSSSAPSSSGGSGNAWLAGSGTSSSSSGGGGSGNPWLK